MDGKTQKSDWDVLNRVGRYLHSVPRMTIFNCRQKLPTELTAYSDTDWAGCRSSRRMSPSFSILQDAEHRAWRAANDHHGFLAQYAVNDFVAMLLDGEAPRLSIWTADREIQ